MENSNPNKRAYSARVGLPPINRRKGQEQDTAFQPLNDEEVFVTRQKQRIQEADRRRINSAKPIWQKTTASSAAPLQRCESLTPEKIEPERQPRLFSAKQKSTLQLAMGVAKSRQQSHRRVQSERAKGVDTMQEYISQKKEMFRVDLADREIRAKIQALDQQVHSRKQALHQSSVELDEDRKQLMAFVEQKNEQKRQVENEEKLKVREKNDNEEHLRVLENQIQQVHCEIEKNRENLSGFNSFKEFIRSLTTPEILLQVDQAKEKQRELIKKEWVAKVMKDTCYDDLVFGYQNIFPEETDILDTSGVVLKSHLIKNKPKHNLGMERQKQRDELTSSDWGLVFEEMMRRDLIDLPEDFIEEAKFFTDPSELEDIYQKQEESNLFCIHRLQDAEDNLELELKRKKMIQETKGRECELLRLKEQQIKERMAHTRQEFEKQKHQSLSILLVKDGNKEKLLDVDGIYTSLKNKMMYVIGNDNEIYEDLLELMQKIEYTTLLKVQEMNVKQQNNPNFNHCVAVQRTKYREAKRAQDLNIHTQELQKKYEKSKLRLLQKPLVRVGRMDMLRSDKIVFKKKEVKQEIDSDEETMLKYIGYF